MRFFKSRNEVTVNQVEILSGYVDEDCTHCSTWWFNLPIELAVEMKEKYNIPKYKKVVIDGEEEILFLDYESFQFEYVLTANVGLGNTVAFEEFDGTDFRLAKEYQGKESVNITWRYCRLYDDGFFDTCDDEDFVELEYGGYTTPHVEIIGDDKELLLKDIHKVMIGVLDGDKRTKKRLFNFCGD